jgi:MoaA/NifB/PqqE/SkfB family radical SAM enzyme
LEAEKLIDDNTLLLNDKDLYKYIFMAYCYNNKFHKAKDLFTSVSSQDMKYKHEMMKSLIEICKNMLYENEVLDFYYLILSEYTQQIGIFEIGNDLIKAKNYIKARDFYKKILDIYPDDFTALKNTVQLSNFIGDFEATKKLLDMLVLNKYKNDDFKYNILLNELEIAEGKLLLKSQPRTMLVTVTTRCNIKCLMCTRDQIWDMPEYIKNEIISMLKYLEVIVWQGGEVFLYEYFFELLKLSKCNDNLKHIIITNGLFFTDEWIDLLLSIKNLDLTVSIDGTTKEVYEKIRIGAKFEQLTDNLDRFSKKKKQISTKQSITLRCAIMKSNYKQIVDFVKFAIKYDFNGVILAPVHNLYTEENIWNNLSDDINDYICEQYDIALELAGKFNINLVTWLPVKKHTSVDNGQNVLKTNIINQNKNLYNDLLCFRPWKQITLNVDGFIMPECLCRKPISTIDTVTSFAEVWNSTIMQEYRKHIINHDYSWCNKDCINGSIDQEHLKFLSR